MKILEIDFDLYQFPKQISSLEEFMQYATKNYNSFIPMVQYQTENCVFPYLIEEDVKTVYLNVAKMDKICVEDATVLCREEYNARLEKVIKQKCVSCEYYEEDCEGDNIQGHGDMISLDGECLRYEKKAD